MKCNLYSFHHGWRFLLANAFPMEKALEQCRDRLGRLPVDREYDDSSWETVSLPHTFNGEDLFAVPIEDGGSGQRRTCAFYRNTLEIPPEHAGKRTILTFEGVRQTCYAYVNGKLAGYYEMGVGPFGFDITRFLSATGLNVIAVVTDNTSTRNIPFCIAETPNRPDVNPGSYFLSQEVKVPENREGVGFSWNCNDFNPVLGGLSHPVCISFKNNVHLTLPIYANLRSKGVYIFADEFELQHGKARIHVNAEIRNQSSFPAECRIIARITDLKGYEIAVFSSGEILASPMPDLQFPLSVVPEDAYIPDDSGCRYIPDETRNVPPDTKSPGTTELSFSATVSGLTFWEPSHPFLYRVELTLYADWQETDTEEIVTGFRQVDYDPDQGLLINGHPVWLRGYAQRSTNEWAESGIVPEWLHDLDARWIRESGANHIRWMHVAASPADLRSCDRQGIVCTQPAGDKEKETFGRQWDQRMELMRNVIIASRNHPSIFFWEAGNNVISAEHMREMRLLKHKLDPHGNRFMGCRTINTEDALAESEYVGTMLNRHAARFLAKHGPVTETEYSREEAPRRIWDDYSPPDYDYRNRFLGKGGKKQKGLDFYDLTSEDLALANARGYSEFFFDRIGGASGKNLYSACAALCWTDSAQHGRQSWSENGRMSGRVDAIRVRKQSFDVFRIMHSVCPAVKILGHWNYPENLPENYLAHEKAFTDGYWKETDTVFRRDPTNKTVYVIASYPVHTVFLSVNGRPPMRCCRPESGFVFPFPNTDITEHGILEATGMDLQGNPVCTDCLKTAGEPARLRLSSESAPGGWRADGNDLVFVDVSVTDSAGQICPLSDIRIDFHLEGDALLLGGYNSGRFNGNGRQDSVIRKPFVFAECGVNRVLIRSGFTPDVIRLTASALGLPDETIILETVSCDLSRLVPFSAFDDYPKTAAVFPASEDFPASVPELDALKYIPETEHYCKVLVNGQEPDFRGVRSVNRNGAIWGNILCILERMEQIAPDRMNHVWNPDNGTLILTSGENRILARIGETHMLINNQESLMDGQPYLTEEGIPVMEISAIAPFVQGTVSRLDEKIGALRIEL